VPLFAKDLTELTTDALEDLVVHTNITRLSPGSKARAILDAVNKRIEEQYDSFDLNLARAFVSTAQGEWLDLIGALLGVARLSSEAASADSSLQIFKFYVDSGTFGDINSGNDIPLAAGTIISSKASSAGTLYRITVPQVAYAADSVAWVSAEAIGTGEEYNVGTGVLTYHDMTSYTNYLSNDLKVSNIHPLANGKNFESDENYRYRIVNSALAAEAANETAIRLAVLSASGVADVLIVKHYRGIGTFGAIIKSITPSASTALVDDVTVRVQAIQGLGSKAFVRAARETGMEFNIVVHYDQRYKSEDIDLIELAIEDLITEEVNGLDTGETFDVSELVARIFEADGRIANLGESANKTLDQVYIYKQSILEDNKVRSQLLGDYTPDFDERVIIEPQLTTPITFQRRYQR
jgi:uncharacterized phage protein gp47/JayE